MTRRLTDKMEWPEPKRGITLRNTTISVRIVGILVEIRTVLPSNTSLEAYRYAEPLGAIKL
jgi:hypothetical protein